MRVSKEEGLMDISPEGTAMKKVPQSRLLSKIFQGEGSNWRESPRTLKLAVFCQ